MKEVDEIESTLESAASMTPDRVRAILTRASTLAKNGGEIRLRVHNAVAGITRNRRYDEVVWQWFCEEARKADEHGRIALVVSFFSDLADEPIDIPWLQRLAKLCSDQELRWIIVHVYEGREALLYEHMKLLGPP